MEITYIIFLLFFAIVALLPSIRISHWTFRVFDFIRIQLLFLQIALLISSIFIINNPLIIACQFALSIAIVWQVYIIYPFLPLKPKSTLPKTKVNSISLISVNVLQSNKEYQRLISLVESVQPSILLTMETNGLWDEGLEKIENTYSFNYKIPKENRYGMHLYTNLEIKTIKEHYFISDETPSIEAHLVDLEGNEFIFWGVHPPPPSPTEKPTARQKDAELMKISKLIRGSNLPTLVAGDFNNVCWSRSAHLFSKVSTLKDARLGRGIFGTFPTRPSIFRFPLDLLFNSKAIEVNEIKVLSDIGSDHLPLFSKFTVTDGKSNSQQLDTELKEEANTIIEEGKEAVKEE